MRRFTARFEDSGIAGGWRGSARRWVAGCSQARVAGGCWDRENARAVGFGLIVVGLAGDDPLCDRVRLTPPAPPLKGGEDAQPFAPVMGQRGQQNWGIGLKTACCHSKALGNWG